MIDLATELDKVDPKTVLLYLLILILGANALGVLPLNLLNNNKIKKNKKQRSQYSGNALSSSSPLQLSDENSLPASRGDKSNSSFQSLPNRNGSDGMVAAPLPPAGEFERDMLSFQGDAHGSAVNASEALTGRAGLRQLAQLPHLTAEEVQDFDFSTRTHDAIRDAHVRHGDFFVANVLGLGEGLFVRDVRAARFALTKTPRFFKLDKGRVPDGEAEASGFTPISRSNLLQPMFYGTVFHLEGEAHRKHRRAIANALAARPESGNAYVREVERELENHWLDSEATSDGWHTVDVQKLAYLAMATGAMQIALGPEFELTPAVRDVLLKGVTEIEQADVGVDTPLVVDGVERNVMLEVLKVLEGVVADMPPSADQRCALYGMQKEGVSMSEIAATLVNFAVAAGESPASGAAHTLASIARLPEIQERVLDEVQAVCPLLPGEDSQELPDALNTQAQLEYTARVVKEAMRHRVPASMVSRVATQETELPAAGGHAIAIPAGTRVVITMSAMHWNDLEFPNPDKFDPDRFVTQSGKAPKGYMTFSAGPRMCPGERITMMWTQMLVAQVLRRFEMRAVPGQDPWDFPHARKFVSWANGGIMCQVRPRDLSDSQA